MEKISIFSMYYLCLTAMVTTLPSFAETCPKPEELEIQEQEGAFVVNPPKDYVYQVAPRFKAITKSGPIEFNAVQIASSLQNRAGFLVLIVASPINCIYGVAKNDAGDAYTGGVFYLLKQDRVSHQFKIATEIWRQEGSSYICGGVPEQPGAKARPEDCEFIAISTTLTSSKPGKEKRIAK